MIPSKSDINRPANLPRGIISVVQTPFDSDNRVDMESLERLVEDTIHSGINGLLAPVVASEVSWLTHAERREIVQRITAVASDRVPLILGASDSSPEACITAANLAEEVGAVAYLVAVPDDLYRKPQEIVPFFRSVAAGNSSPLIVQDFQFNGPGMSLDVIQELRESLHNLVGLKIETVPAGPKYTAVREVLPPDFFIAGGWAVMQMIEALDRGVDA
ncbi:MAG: dihydrodipicolinate synthase family protein, partial [Pirellulales bacterium]|nr:dihydrodipicolinate synthase family protein [Pirellulales bacterium]